MSKKMIFKTDPEAAREVTITGWVDINGRFFGKEESLARYSSATHTKCNCGSIIKKGYVRCDKCQEVIDIERYKAMPFMEWDEECPVYSESAQRYFFDPSDIKDYCKDNEINSDDLRLYICLPVRFRPLTTSWWEDELTEDQDELPKWLIDAIDNLNEIIQKQPNISWYPGNVRTEYKIR